MATNQGWFMSNEWSKRGKRWREQQLEGMKLLFGDACNAPSVAVAAQSPKKSTKVAPQDKKTPSKRRIEQQHQTALARWMDMQGVAFFAIVNEGKRSVILGAILKRMGLKAGVCDMFVMECKGGYGGFFIEMKAPGEKPKAHQIEFMNLARQKGYKASWYDDWERAKLAVQEYMALK